MQKRRLGRTGLDVSLLTFGCGAVGGLMTKGAPSEQLRAVRRALELGVNFFDTAPLYGDGASETNVGRIFKEVKPDVILGTKVNVPPDGKRDIAGAINRSIEESLKRLQRDHVDLLQLHNSISGAGAPRDLTADIVLGEVVPAFQKLKAQGKIRFFGITAIGDTASLHRVIDAKAFDTAQIVYNMLNPSAGGPVPPGFPGQDYGQILNRAHAAGMGAIVIRALAAGALSGEDARHPNALANVAPIGSGADYQEDLQRARHLRPALVSSGATDLVELAVRYVASHPAVSTLQVGIATFDQFEGGAQAVLKGALPAATLAKIAELQSKFATA